MSIQEYFAQTAVKNIRIIAGIDQPQGSPNDLDENKTQPNSKMNIFLCHCNLFGNMKPKNCAIRYKPTPTSFTC